MPLLLLMGLDGFMQLHHAISNRMIFSSKPTCKTRKELLPAFFEDHSLPDCCLLPGSKRMRSLLAWGSWWCYLFLANNIFGFFNVGSLDLWSVSLHSRSWHNWRDFDRLLLFSRRLLDDLSKKSLLLVSDHIVDRTDGLEAFVELFAVIAFPFFRAVPKFHEDQLCYLIVVHVRFTFRVFKMIAYNLFD